MAFNNGFPATYQPVYYQPQYQQQVPQMQPQIQPQQQASSIIWVSGEAGAKSYLVAPNTTVQLWDSEAQKIYLKSADASGMPSMKVLEYTICGQTASTAPVAAAAPVYATKDDVNALYGRLEALQNEVKELTADKKKGGENDG